MPALVLRPWQREALTAIDGHQGNNFLAVAMPGSGKTILALAEFQRRPGHKLLVVAPTVHLRRQWAKSAAKMGIELDWMSKNGHYNPDAFDGAVITYAQLWSASALWQSHVRQYPTMAVLDEIHRCADEAQWGTQVARVATDATFRLLLSGTPFRGDGNPLPFVEYDDNDRCVIGYHYAYPRAVAENVCRSVEFITIDATCMWTREYAPFHGRLSQVSLDQIGPALRSAYETDSQWINIAFAQAIGALDTARITCPDAGGLVIASTQQRAKQYQQMLETMTGEPVAVATCDDAHAHDVIAAYAAGTQKWLVAVDMVSEGVDIPRLAVGVYASGARTQRYFTQAIGRFLRCRPGIRDVTKAIIIVPATADLESAATRLPDVQYAALRTARTESDGGLRQIAARSHIEVMGAVDARVIGRFSPTPPPPTPVVVADTAPQSRRPPAFQSSVETQAEKMARTRQAIHLLVQNRVKGTKNLDTKALHSKMNRIFGGMLASATLDQLDARVKWLTGSLAHPETEQEPTNMP